MPDPGGHTLNDFMFIGKGDGTFKTGIALDNSSYTSNHLSLVDFNNDGMHMYSPLQLMAGQLMMRITLTYI